VREQTQVCHALLLTTADGFSDGSRRWVYGIPRAALWFFRQSFCCRGPGHFQPAEQPFFFALVVVRNGTFVRSALLSQRPRYPLSGSYARLRSPATSRRRRRVCIASGAARPWHRTLLGIGRLLTGSHYSNDGAIMDLCTRLSKCRGQPVPQDKHSSCAVARERFPLPQPPIWTGNFGGCSFISVPPWRLPGKYSSTFRFTVPNGSSEFESKVQLSVGSLLSFSFRMGGHA